MIDQEQLASIFKTNFIEYASYVIKDRAIPEVLDGLKPVQRRILHSLWEMDDGRFHKVANVIGHTMKYHPHGDASIGDALVVVANKDYFIDKQGNFGNVLTGDGSSAPRYIECRLTPLAKDVLYNHEITEFADSYDGRNKEPVLLPCKIPYLLLQGAEGIAVGMSTKIMPHNFNEVLDAQIKYLRGEEFTLYPDFPQGGFVDVSEYDDGRGKIRVRALIRKKDNKTIVVHETPYSVTSESLMNNIEDAVRKNKIKAAGIRDYTTDKVEIEVGLQRGAYASEMIERLFAYTDCEISISSNMIAIEKGKPVQTSVSEVLRKSTDELVEILKKEIILLLGKLKDKFHHKSLEQIFIENRIYRKIENSESFDEAINTVDSALKKFVKDWEREVIREDIEKLLEIPIKRITKFDLDKSQQELEDILSKIKVEEGHLKSIKRYTISFLKGLIKKYGAAHPRKTKIQSFEAVSAKDIKDKDTKVFYDLKTGYVGTKVKGPAKLECSSFDKILLIGRDGKYQVTPITDKFYCGKLVYFGLADKKQVFNCVTRDSKSKSFYVKRFKVDKFIQNKEYSFLDKGHKLVDFSSRPKVVFKVRYEKKIKDLPDEERFPFDEYPVKAGSVRGSKIGTRKILKVDITRQ